MSLLDKFRNRRRDTPEGKPADPTGPIDDSGAAGPTETAAPFDVWADAATALATVTRLLEGSAVEFVVLPPGTTEMPTVVLAAAAGRTALAALQAGPGTERWGVVTQPRRGLPAEPAALADLADTKGLRSLTLSPTPGAVMLRQPNVPRASVELQLWRRVTESGAPRRDGGSFAEGTLLAPARNRLVDYLEPSSWQRGQQTPQHWPRPPLPHLFDVTEPIDLVYTWVDGSDPEWLARKQAAHQQLHVDAAHSPDAFSAARYADHDELRYSLRSVQAYASWVHHIWLVTDGQTPSWLDTDHPGITVVDHRDIFADPSALPVFNSHAIESQLHHIEGLTERYLYVNDDVFFGVPVRPELFFHGNGIAKLFPSSALLDAEDADRRDVPVQAAAKRSRDLIEQEFRRTFSQKTQHVPLPQIKSVLNELEHRFPTEFDAVMRSRFRHPDDLAVPSSLALYWAYATGRAVVGSMAYGYLDLSAPTTAAKFADWLQRRPFECFCLNDSAGQQTPELTESVTAFLDAYYPHPSSYEG